MIENSGKKRKTIWQIFIVLMMFLMVVFLVAPASAHSVCKPTYSKYYKAIEPPILWDTWDKPVYQYTVPSTHKTIEVFVTYTRSITNWHQERIKFIKERCAVNDKCEVNGQEIQKRTGKTTLGRPTPINVYCVTT